MNQETYEMEREKCSNNPYAYSYELDYQQAQQQCRNDLESRRNQITCCMGYVKVGDECKGKQF